MAGYETKGRPITMKIDGKGPYIVMTASVVEGISEAFKLTAVVASEALLTEKGLGKTVNLYYEGRDESRQFNAVLSSFELQDYSEEKAAYFYEIEAIAGQWSLKEL